MKGLFLDAVDDLADVFRRVVRPDDPPVTVNEQLEVPPDTLPKLLAGYDFMFDDHSQLPTDTMRRCTGLKHIIFLGTGARSYMHPEELAEHGITVHIIKGYGDTAVAEHTIALMWAAARGLAIMDGGMRRGEWIRTEGMQLTGKTLGLLGYGGIAAEVARIAAGSGMRVIAWNRSPKTAPGVTFVDLDTLLAESDVLSVHLLLTDETRGFLDAERSGEAAARCRAGEHGARRDRRRGGDDRRAAHRPAAACRAGCVQQGAAGARPRIDDAAQRHALGAQRVPHARGVGEPHPPRSGHREGARYRCISMMRSIGIMF